MSFCILMDDLSCAVDGIARQITAYIRCVSCQIPSKAFVLWQSIESKQYVCSRSLFGLVSAVCRHLMSLNNMKQDHLTWEVLNIGICIHHGQRWISLLLQCWCKSNRLHYSASISMMTSSNGNIYRVTGHLCGEFTGPRWIPRTQRPVTRSFDVFFDLRLNKRLRKQSWGWWFETLSRPLWRQCNAKTMCS